MALLRYQLALLGRSYRGLAPALLYAAVVVAGSFGGMPLADGLGWSSAMLVPAVGWLTRVALTMEPGAARACASTAGGARRGQLGEPMGAVGGGGGGGGGWGGAGRAGSRFRAGHHGAAPAWAGDAGGGRRRGRGDLFADRVGDRGAVQSPADPAPGLRDDVDGGGGHRGHRGVGVARQRGHPGHVGGARWRRARAVGAGGGRGGAGRTDLGGVDMGGAAPGQLAGLGGQRGAGLG